MSALLRNRVVLSSASCGLQEKPPSSWFDVPNVCAVAVKNRGLVLGPGYMWGMGFFGDPPRGLGSATLGGCSRSVWAALFLSTEMVSVFPPVLIWKVLEPGWMTLKGPTSIGMLEGCTMTITTKLMKTNLACWSKVTRHGGRYNTWLRGRDGNLSVLDHVDTEVRDCCKSVCCGWISSLHSPEEHHTPFPLRNILRCCPDT